MKYIGAHVSASGGVENAPLNANAIGAKAFALLYPKPTSVEIIPVDEEKYLLIQRTL